MGPVHLTLDEVRDLARRCLEANGCDSTNARAVAATIKRAEADGSAGHGLLRLPGYVASLRSGKVRGDARPRVSQSAPSVLRVDGHGGFAPLALKRMHDDLVALTRSQGIAAAALVDTYHFAALWIEVEALAREGLLAIAVTASKPAVAPTGATRAFYGTNPIAFGWPRPGEDPMVFDLATAAMARGEIMIAARDGHEVPEGVGLGADGRPTTNPARILDGVQLPFGGYKGAALALMVELLAGGLIGEAFSYEAGTNDNKDGGPARGGELIIALDPAAFGDADGWQGHAERFFAELESFEGTRLPGDRRYENRARTPEEGIDVPETLHRQIMSLCDG